jgi:hypothetical protein
MSFPDFAEPVIGPATSGRTRWLNPGYDSSDPIVMKPVTTTGFI